MSGATLRGRVESWGQPVFAKVELVRAKSNLPTYETLTDQHGRFAFPNVAPGSYTLRLSAWKFFDKEQGTSVGKNDDDIGTIVLKRVECGRDYSHFYFRSRSRGAEYVGRAVDEDERPFAGASVLLTPAGIHPDPFDDNADQTLTNAAAKAKPGNVHRPAQSRLTRSRSSVTGPTGEFHFRGIEPGWYDLAVTAPGYRQVTITPVWLKAGRKALFSPDHVTARLERCSGESDCYPAVISLPVFTLCE